MNNIITVINNYRILLNKLLNSESYFIEDFNINFKDNQKQSKHNIKGVYLILDKNNEVIYAGKTNSILDRLGNQHVYGGSGSDLRNMLGRPNIKEIFQYKVRYIEIKDERERSRFECFVISVFNPKFNFGLSKSKNETS